MRNSSRGPHNMITSYPSKLSSQSLNASLIYWSPYDPRPKDSSSCTKFQLYQSLRHYEHIASKLSTNPRYLLIAKSPKNLSNWSKTYKNDFNHYSKDYFDQITINKYSQSLNQPPNKTGRYQILHHISPKCSLSWTTKQALIKWYFFCTFQSCQKVLFILVLLSNR